jgi:hypothetical protein
VNDEITVLKVIMAAKDQGLNIVEGLAPSETEEKPTSTVSIE